MKQFDIVDAYENEHMDAISTLCNVTRRLRSEIDNELQYPGAEGLTELVKAYAPAQLALLQLMKEEINESEVYSYE